MVDGMKVPDSMGLGRQQHRAFEDSMCQPKYLGNCVSQRLPSSVVNINALRRAGTLLAASVTLT